MNCCKIPQPDRLYTSIYHYTGTNSIQIKTIVQYQYIDYTNYTRYINQTKNNQPFLFDKKYKLQIFLPTNIVEIEINISSV